jgi:uncharacterized membrane protein YfcA
MQADVIFDLPLQTLLIVWLGAFVGGFASGAAGFAFGIVGSAIWLHAIDPLHVTMLIVAGGTTIQCGTIWPLRRSIKWNRVWPFLVPGLVGIPVGVALLVYVDARALKVALGVFLAIYGTYTLIAPTLPKVSAGGRVADGGIGFIGGMLGGLSGLNGVLPAIWCQLRGWSKEEARAIYQPFILATHIGILATIGVVALDRQGIILFLVALPALIAGALSGWSVYGRLDDRRFRQTLAILLVASGVLLVV